MSATEEAVIARPSRPAEADDTHISRALLMVATVVVLGAIMSILDTTVVNVAINTLAARFHTTLPTIQWVATGYTLALATVIPLSRLDRRPLRHQASVHGLDRDVRASARASSGWPGPRTTIILFRVLQGLGGGMIMPAGMTILTRAAGPQRVGRVMAMMGVPMLLGPILGPILGGWLVPDVSGAGSSSSTCRSGSPPCCSRCGCCRGTWPQPSQRLDWVGLADCVSPGLALVIYGLAESSSSGGFGHGQGADPAVRRRSCCCAASSGTRCATRDPLIDLRLFKNRAFATSSISLILMMHLRLRRVPAAAAVLPVRARRVAADGRRAAGAAGPRLDDHDADRRPAVRQDRLRSDRPVRPDSACSPSVIWLTQIGAHTSCVWRSASTCSSSGSAWASR